MFAGKSSKCKDFRGPGRDAQADLQRSGKVLEAISEALSSLDGEAVGLRRRVEELRAWVGGLVGPEDGSADCRDVRIELELVDAERQLMQGVHRLCDLAAIRARYDALQAAIAAERERAQKASHADG